jgi:hypothetical protein
MSPYIGVTGFMTEVEVAAAVAAFDALPNSRQRVLMVGVLASSKTLRGEQNRWPNRYPKVGEIARLLSPHRRVLNLIHFATDDQHTLRDQIEQLMDFGGRYLDGFQLNMSWPEPDHFRVVQGMRIVLQLGPRALAMCNDPDQVAVRLDDYNSLITDVLLDGSGGHGVPIDVESAATYVRAIGARHRELGLGVAGGLSHEGLDRIQPLMDEFPWLSFDAEGRLRTPAPEDTLDLELTRRYIAKAGSMCSR